MAYFSNGAEGLDYEKQWCERCAHYPDCAVLLAHSQYNYEHCNNKESILHILIPRKGIHNEKCKMFMKARNKDD